MAGTSDTPEGSPMGPDDINSRLAEIAAELASEAKFKEPSAAERARAARAAAAAKPGAPTRRGPLRRWRADRTADKLRTPVRPPGAPEPVRQRAPRRARRAHRAAWAEGRPAPDRGYSDSSHPSTRRSVLTVVVIVALLIGVSIGARNLLHRSPAAATGGASGASNSGTPTQTPAATTPAASAADPFASVPADYANGAAGIIVPPAVPTGSFTATQVSKAFAVVKQLVIAADLNSPTLNGGRPAKFASLLLPAQRKWFNAGLAKTGFTKNVPNSSRVWVNSFLPGSVTFVTTTVKVFSEPMTASVATVQHRKVLQIFGSYIFVYAVQKPGVPGTLLRVVTRSKDTVDFAHWTDSSGPLQPWLTNVEISDAGVLCGTTDGYLHPQFPQPGQGNVTPSGTPQNPYNPAWPTAASGSCGVSGGT
jgi:hypothetical protein